MKSECYTQKLSRGVYSHGERVPILISELGFHLKVTMAAVINTTGILEVDLID